MSWAKTLEPYLAGHLKGIFHHVWRRSDGWLVSEVSFNNYYLWFTRAPDGHRDPRFRRRFTSSEKAMAAIDKRVPLK